MARVRHRRPSPETRARCERQSRRVGDLLQRKGVELRRDPQHELVIARPESDETLPHVCVVGDTYTILVSGKQTNGRYSLLDMLVPDQGGRPSPHRHDFEELFILLDGEIEFMFRDSKHIVRAGESINIPANAPHNFKNVSGQTARMLCMCSPANAHVTPPNLSTADQQRRKRLLFELVPKYRTELLIPND